MAFTRKKKSSQTSASTKTVPRPVVPAANPAPAYSKGGVVKKGKC